MLDDETAETVTCPDCGATLEAFLGGILGIRFVRYRCERHAFNERMEFLT